MTVWVQEDIQFKPGEPQTVTVSDASKAMKGEITGVLTEVSRQLRAASIEECSGGPNADSGPASGKSPACEIATIDAVADAIQPELDTVTALGKDPQGACPVLNLL